jgi:hypothetical protein
MDLALVLAACGRVATTLWIIGGVLVLAGIYALIRHERVPGAALIAAGILIGPAGATIAC